MNLSPTPPLPQQSNQKSNRTRFIRVGISIIASLFVLTWLAYTPDGLLGKADAIGYAVCHRIDIRSFHLGNRPVALCARCTGQYLGTVFALVFLTFLAPKYGGRPSWFVIGILGILAFAWGFDGLNSFAYLIPSAPNLYTPNNTFRLFTGMGFGLSMGTASFVAFNQTVWRNWLPNPVIGNLRRFGFMLIGATGVGFLVLTENPYILYPLSLVSAGGVLLLLTMIYTMILLTLVKQENKAENVNDLILPLLAGFCIGLLQIALLDLLRFWATGTWEGFHITLG